MAGMRDQLAAEMDDIGTAQAQEEAADLRRPADTVAAARKRAAGAAQRAQTLAADAIPATAASALEITGMEPEFERGPGIRVGRTERQPFGSTEQTLAVPDIPGYRQYWFNDTPGRVERAIRAGYTHVTDHRGENVQRVVDRREGGGGLQAYLMKIPLEWYYEDMGEQQDVLARKLADIREGRGQGDNTYVAKHHSVVQR